MAAGHTISGEVHRTDYCEATRKVHGVRLGEEQRTTVIEQSLTTISGSSLAGASPPRRSLDLSCISAIAPSVPLDVYESSDDRVHGDDDHLLSNATYAGSFNGGMQFIRGKITGVYLFQRSYV